MPRYSRMQFGPTGQCGVALVVVMWLVAALSILASGLVATTRADVRGTQILKQFAAHAALGDAAIRLAASQLKLEPLEDRPAVFHFGFEGYELEVQVVPASAFVNLNNAPIELLRDTLQFGAGLDEGQARILAERIADWRDPDEDPLPAGAEFPAYEAAQSPFRPRNGPFESVDDLIQVLGMNFDLHDKLRGLFTTQGSAQGVDPRFAPPAVLSVLAAGNAAAVERVMGARLMRDPISDMTGLTQQYLASIASGPLRFVALHRSERVELIRSRWIELSPIRPEMPWTELTADPVESVERMAEGFHGA